MAMTVNDECKLKYMELLREDDTFGYIVFKIDKETNQVIVDKVYEQLEVADFVPVFPPDECRYAVYNFPYDPYSPPVVLFITWTPEPADVRSKVLYAKSKEMLTRELCRIDVDFRATETNELSLPQLMRRAYH